MQAVGEREQERERDNEGGGGARKREDQTDDGVVDHLHPSPGPTVLPMMVARYGAATTQGVAAAKA